MDRPSITKKPDNSLPPITLHELLMELYGQPAVPKRKNKRPTDTRISPKKLKAHAV